MSKPRAPRELKTGGRALWNQVLDDFELHEHERAVLLQACRIRDSLDRLQAVIDASSVVIESPQGMKVHPALIESRQQAVTFAKCMATLRVPTGDEDKVPQQRAGVRGPRAA